MKTLNTLKTLVAAAALGMSAQGLAATNGTAGSTSSGSIEVSANIVNTVQVSGLEDITFAGGGNNEDMTALLGDICIFSNSGTGGYQVKLSSAHAGDGGFTLAGGAADMPVYLPYTVSWNDSPSAAGESFTLTSGEPVSVIHGANNVSMDCSQGDKSAALGIKVAATAWQKVKAGTYTDTLTVEVAPE